MNVIAGFKQNGKPHYQYVISNGTRYKRVCAEPSASGKLIALDKSKWFEESPAPVRLFWTELKEPTLAETLEKTFQSIPGINEFIA